MHQFVLIQAMGSLFHGFEHCFTLIHALVCTGIDSGMGKASLFHCFGHCLTLIHTYGFTVSLIQALFHTDSGLTIVMHVKKS